MPRKKTVAATTQKPPRRSRRLPRRLPRPSSTCCGYTWQVSTAIVRGDSDDHHDLRRAPPGTIRPGDHRHLPVADAGQGRADHRGTTLVKKLPVPLRRFIGTWRTKSGSLWALTATQEIETVAMPPKKKPTKREQELLKQVEQLRLQSDEQQIRLTEAEETLQAIRGGEVDAVVVSGAKGDQIFSLVGTDLIYRLIVETMRKPPSPSPSTVRSSSATRSSGRSSSGRWSWWSAIPFRSLSQKTTAPRRPRFWWPHSSSRSGSGWSSRPRLHERPDPRFGERLEPARRAERLRGRQ